MGKYTNLESTTVNDQFIKVITQHLNPNMNAFIDIAQEELSHSFDVDFPDLDDDGR